MTDNFKSISSREQIMAISKNDINRNADSKNKVKANSPYGQMLRESKKISLFYGDLSKKYLQKIFYKSCSQSSKVSENLFLILESRLDVVLYRSGFFESIASARQIIRTGAIKVNSKKVISSSYSLIPGDIISVFGDTKRKQFFEESLDNNNLSREARMCNTHKLSILPRKKVGWRFKASSPLLSKISKSYQDNILFFTQVIRQNLCFLPTTNGLSFDKSKYNTLTLINTIKRYINLDFNKNKQDVKKIMHQGFTPSNLRVFLASKMPAPSGNQRLYSALCCASSDAKERITYKGGVKASMHDTFNTKFGSKNLTFFDRIAQFSEKIIYYNISTHYFDFLVKRPLDLLQQKSLAYRVPDARLTPKVINRRLTAKCKKDAKQVFSSNMPFIFVNDVFSKALKDKFSALKMPTFSNISKSFNVPDLKNEKNSKTNRTSVILTESKKITHAKNLFLTPLFYNFDNVSSMQDKGVFVTCFTFLNYLLNLKKQSLCLQKKKINYKKQQHQLFFKNQKLLLFKKTKALHLEVSYKSLSIIFLFPPQRLNFPSFINPSLIYK